MKNDIIFAFNHAYELAKNKPEEFKLIQAAIVEIAIQANTINDFQYGFFKGCLEQQFEHKMLNKENYMELSSIIASKNETCELELEELSQENNIHKDNDITNKNTNDVIYSKPENKKDNQKGM